MWKDHFWHLLLRSLDRTFTVGGSTWVGVIIISGCQVTLGFLAMGFFEWLRGGRTKMAWKIALQTWPAYAGGAVALFIPWLCVLVWAGCATIYQDHQDLIAINRILSQQVIALQTAKLLPSPTGAVPVRSTGKPAIRAKPTVEINAPIKQETNAPCSANAVGGDVSIKNCGRPDPYKPIVLYYPNGAKSIKPAYGLGVDTDNSLVPVGDEMNRLTKQEDWSRLLALVERTRKNDPEWLVLDGESGVAKLGLCELSGSISDLKKFIDETEHIPQYSAQREMALLNLDLAKQPNYLMNCLSAKARRARTLEAK